VLLLLQLSPSISLQEGLDSLQKLAVAVVVAVVVVVAVAVVVVAVVVVVGTDVAGTDLLRVAHGYDERQPRWISVSIFLPA
jgi:hypothetical protein